MMNARLFAAFARVSLGALIVVVLDSGLVSAIIVAKIQEQTDSAWKAATLRVIDRQLGKSELKETDRLELRSQKRWLTRWNPGTLSESANPKNASEVPTKRSEAMLNSSLINRLREIEKTGTGMAEQDKFARMSEFATDHPNDFGLQQALIHWADNDPKRRKQFLDQIESLTLQLSNQIAQQLNSKPPKSAEMEALNNVLHFMLYRHVRCLAYRELPDVVAKKPIDDQKVHDEKIDSAFEKLVREAGAGRPEFILIEIRMLRRAKKFGQALERLEAYGASISSRWYLKKRRDLLKELGWDPPWKIAAGIYSRKFPDAGD